ncbi:MAG: DUF2341 domain-containing protein [Chitinispirillaceae bacterium]|nr:DUF2341 domain-containing protein [Chitinispirillaceae bacterium]
MRTIFPHRTGCLIAIAAMVGALLSTQCIAPLGGGSEAGNARITGAVVDTLGYPVANALVTVRPWDFDPVKNPEVPASCMDTTGPDGIYRVSVQKGIAYRVEALVPIQGTSALRALVGEVLAQEPDTIAPRCTVKTAGAIKVTIPESADHAFGYVFIPGTSRFTFLNNARESVVLDSVPAGTIPAVSYSSTKTEDFSVIRYTIPVEPGDTTVILLPSWKYARQLILNTTPSGADVASNVLGFPVCIRLHSDNFDFSQARPNGADIRFTKMDNTPLPYEIECWDSAGGHAEVWVMVDTVLGNNSDQSIMMYWGNAAAIDRSNGAAVFDTAAGFQGVWHLAEAGNTTAKDATSNRYHGTPSGMSAQSAVDGMIGGAQEFEGSASHFSMANTASSTLNFPVNGPYTISAWVYIDSLDGEFHTIVSKGSRQYSLGAMGSLWGFSVCPESGGFDVTNVAAESKAWVHLVGIRNGSLQYLYVNGVCVDSSITNTFPGTTRFTGDDLAVGKNPSNSADIFNGILDEVCIAGVARDPAWIRLSYMNQMSDDRLVQRKK